MLVNKTGNAVYENCISLIESISEYLKEIKDGIPSQNLKLTKPMLRKLVSSIGILFTTLKFRTIFRTIYTYVYYA